MMTQQTDPTRPRRLVPLTYAEETLGLSYSTIRRYIAAGHLTAYRVGPQVLRLDANEVDALAKPVPSAADWS